VTTTTEPVTPSTNRETAIKVSARSDPNSLAKTIARALLDSPRVQVRAMGAGAVNQSVKAIAIARGIVATRGLDLVDRPGFETTTDITRPGTSGSDELSIMVFHVSAD
jgi:stage V sporulation protein S